MSRQQSANRRRAAEGIHSTFLAFAVLIATAGPPAAAGIGASGVPPPASAAPAQLQLEIFIDDKPARLVGAFLHLPDGRISSKRSELREAGIAAPGSGADDEDIVLETLPGLYYRYDETTQTIRFTVPAALRAAHDYDGAGPGIEGTPATSATGAVLNYDLFSSALRSTQDPHITYQGASAGLDARVFSQFGTLSQTAILGSTTSSRLTALRLETAFSYSDPGSLITYKAGDTISSGLAWTRPVRLGGLQAQRNFGLRPDLVTLPLPSVSGSAAVPSTLDVYVNNVKTFSQEVETGPYRINNLPLLGGDGTARVVLHDASGHEIEQTLPFFATARLLKPGLMDYSIEAGLPRQFFGVDSASYSRKPVASASLRRGIFDWLTVETHAEGGAGLYNAGIGAIVRVFDRASLSSAVSASRSSAGMGFQSYASLETRLWGVSVNAASLRTFGTFDDLASVTAASAPKSYGSSVSAGGSFDPYAIRVTIRPPRAQDRVSISLPVPFDRSSSIGLSFVNQTSVDRQVSRLVSASYSRTLAFNASFYLSAFKDLGSRKETGVFMGLSAPLGPRLSASAGFSFANRGWSATSELARPLGRETGSYGWRVRDSEGKGQSSAQYATGSYRSPYGRLEVGASQQRGSTQGTAEFEGSVATLGGGVYLGNRIDDSFAVVDAGAPDVEVLFENRVAGRTNAQGKILLPELHSYQRNKIEINPLGLPMDAAAGTTQDVIAPADRSGILVDFKVKTNIKAAVVILQDKTGKMLAPGLTGALAGQSERFAVGYDGRAYVAGLGPSNSVTIDTEAGSCTANFAYAPAGEAQTVIGPVICQ